MKPNNPFLISGYHSPKYFCDREKETKKMLDALANERNITLIAPRRMGKTGLIHQVFYRLNENEPNIITFYMDIYPTASLGDFVRLFADTVLGKLDPLENALDRTTKYVQSCHPSLCIGELIINPKIVYEVPLGKEETALKEIFSYLASSEKRIYIAIDEFQQIENYPEKNFEALLRSYIQSIQNVNFIYSGSKEHTIGEMFTSPKRPFYQSSELLTISEIDQDEYYSFAYDFFYEKNIILPEEIFEIIYNKYDGHTWYIQYILNRLYSYNRDISVKLLAHIIKEILSEYSFMYANLLKAYSLNQQRLVKAIAREGRVKEILSGDFIHRNGLHAASSVSGAIKKLLDKELIRKSPYGEYIVCDRFLDEWLRKQPF